MSLAFFLMQWRRRGWLLQEDKLLLVLMQQVVLVGIALRKVKDLRLGPIHDLLDTVCGERRKRDRIRVPWVCEDRQRLLALMIIWRWELKLLLSFDSSLRRGMWLDWVRLTDLAAHHRHRELGNSCKHWLIISRIVRGLVQNNDSLQLKFKKLKRKTSF